MNIVNYDEEIENYVLREWKRLSDEINISRFSEYEQSDYTGAVTNGD